MIADQTRWEHKRFWELDEIPTLPAISLFKASASRLKNRTRETFNGILSSDQGCVLCVRILANKFKSADLVWASDRPIDTTLLVALVGLDQFFQPDLYQVAASRPQESSTPLEGFTYHPVLTFQDLYPVHRSVLRIDRSSLQALPSYQGLRNHLRYISRDSGNSSI